jgi:hypothetical protein
MKRSIRTQFAVVFCLFTCGLTGCGEPKPDGLPKLQPVSLSFIQEGQPCENASVHLNPVDENPWAVGGTADSTGTVVFRTHGKYSGAPAGKYKVTVSKTDREEIGPPPKDMFDIQQETVMYDLVDPVYSNPATTPLEIEVEPGKHFSKTFDLGKKIRNKMKKPGGVNVGVMDGAVRFISNTIYCGNLNAAAVQNGPSPFGVWGALGSPSGGETVASP